MSTGDHDRPQGRRDETAGAGDETVALPLDEGDRHPGPNGQTGQTGQTGDETVALPVTGADPVDPTTDPAGPALAAGPPAGGPVPPSGGTTVTEVSTDAVDEPSGRRTPLLVAGAIALVLVAALVVWLATRGDEPTTTTPGPSPSVSEPATGTPTDSGTPSGTASDSGSVTTTETTTAAPDEPVPTTIPAGLTLPAEGDEGWTSTGWTFQPCGTQVSAAGTSDFRRITFDGPEDSRDQSLLVFPTADDAVAFMGSLRTATEVCAGPGDPLQDVAAVSLQTVEGDWAESLMVVQSYPVPEGGYSPGGDYTLAVRQGSSVAVSGGYAEWPPGYPDPNPDAVAEYRAALDELAPELCVFTEDGC